jgi:isocitrate/isopropylmalate dehydrogenase
MNDWKSELGYTVEVRDESDATDKEVEKIQKLDLAVSKMPNNRTLQSIHKKTVLEFAKLDATEVKDVMKEEQENLIQEALMQAQVIEAQRNGGLPAGQPQMQLPQSTQMPAQVAN